MSLPVGRKAVAAVGLCAAVTILISTSALAADNSAAPNAQDTESAVWTPKQLQFDYQGFTARYTCDGLRDQMRDVLLALGARKQDLKVIEQPCSTVYRPDPFPGVKIEMSVPTPAATAAVANSGLPVPLPADPNSQPMAAHWKKVKLPLHETGVDASTDCELVEQIKQKVLPLFVTRNVSYQDHCIPHEATVGGTVIEAEVLVIDQKGRKAPPVAKAE